MVEYTVCYTIPQVHTAHINTTFIFLHDPLLCNQLWCARNSQSDSENISWIQVMSFVVVNIAACTVFLVTLDVKLQASRASAYMFTS